MASEAQIRASLQILKTSGALTLLNYGSKPTAFTADVTGTKGPVPGAVTVDLDGTNINFSELTTPGLCVIKNQDATNFLHYGVWDPETNTFYPLGELLPGEHTVLRLSRLLSGELGTGAGTTGPNTNSLHLRADTANVNASVEAFEK